MKEATLNQAGKVLEVIGQKGIPREQLQKLLGSGLLSDLLDANVDSVDRDTFRQAIGLKPLGAHTTITRYPMLIDYDRLVEDGIKAGKYDWKNDDIMSKNFPSQETGTREATVELFRYGKDMSTDEVLAELDKQGYRPATLKELLAIGEKHPDLQKEFPIFALGSVWQNPSDGRGCPCLSGGGSKRRLILDWIDFRWDGRCRFAAVRK